MVGHPSNNKRRRCKFLREEEQTFHDMMIEANNKVTNALVTPITITNIWNNTADMRLIHCLIVDDVRKAYLQRNEVLNRIQLDAQSGPNMLPCIEEVIAQ